MGWGRGDRLPLVMWVLGLVLAASLVLIVLRSTAATGPVESSLSGSVDTTLNGGASGPVGPSRSEFESGTRIHDPKPPPERLPQPTLLLLDDGASRASSARQPGVSVYHHWVVDGKPDAHEAEPPISWPEPLRATSTDKAVVDLGTKVRPGTVEVYVYEKVGTDGVPVGEEPTTVLTCESGRLKPGRLGEDSAPCAAPQGGDSGYQNLRLILPTSSWRGEHFFVVWASWPVPVDENANRSAQTPAYDGSWIFSLEIVR